MKIKVVGIEKVQKQLKANVTMSDVKRVVRTNGNKMNEVMKKNTETAFVKGYSTGDTASSINTTLESDGLTAEVGPTTAYAPYVEYGTRFMKAEPFVKPAFDVQKEEFKKDLKKLMR